MLNNKLSGFIDIRITFKFNILILNKQESCFLSIRSFLNRKRRGDDKILIRHRYYTVNVEG